MTLFVQRPELAEVQKWLDLGYDVQISGGPGSGRTELLRTIRMRATDAGWHVLQVCGRPWARGRWSALLAHELVVGERRTGPWTFSELVGLFDEELHGGKNLLLVDDADLLDFGSMSVLGALLDRRDVRFCGVVSRAPKVRVDEVLLRSRRAARVNLGAMTYDMVAELLVKRLGAFAETALVSMIASESAGVPGAVISLIDAARHSGVAENVGGIWRQTSREFGLSLTPVVHALTSSLTKSQVGALVELSWRGPVSLEALTKIADESVVGVLVKEGLIAPISAKEEGEELFAVTPPILSRGLLAGLDKPQKSVFGFHIGPMFGNGEKGYFPAFLFAEADMAKPWDKEVVDEAARVSAAVRDRALVQDAAHLAAWRVAPSMSNAVAYLDGLVNRPPSSVIDEVIEGTVRGDSDSQLTVSRFEVERAVWEMWRRVGLDAERPRKKGRHIDDVFSGSVVWPDWHVNQAVSQLREAMERDVDDESVESEALAWQAIVKAGVLLESGQIEKALAIIEKPLQNHQGSATWYLRGMQVDALLLKGDLAGGEGLARSGLALALSSFDALGIRTQSLRLAEAFWLQARDEEAWQALAVSFWLGPPAPFEAGYYERTLALGVILGVEREDMTTAESLAHELESLPETFPAVLAGMRIVARSALAFTHGDEKGSETILSEGASKEGSRGAFVSALLCLVERRSAFSKSALADALTTGEVAVPALLEPILAVHQAAAKGAAEEMIKAVSTFSGGLGMPFLYALYSAASEEQKDELRRAMRPSVWNLVEANLQKSNGNDALTEREKQIATLVSSGYSNKQIADQLVLSVRTVENHLYRAMNKLGVSAREDLGAVVGKW